MPERRAYADRAEYLKLAVAKRRKKIRQMLVEYKGSKCVLLCVNCHGEVHAGYKQPTWATK